MRRMETGKESQLLKMLSEVSFVMDELSLFLDTHPDEQDAIACYQEYHTLREELLKEYAEKFGPLRMQDVTDSTQWLWATQAWPWKGEC